MLDIILFESIISVILIVLAISFWKCMDVPEKTFGIFLILLMLILVAKNSIDCFVDPHRGERPTMEDVLNGDTTIVSDTTIKQSVYWNEELK
jgi:hypothetical protein